MHILIIGGTRFVGPPAVRRLIEMGHAVTLFHRGRTPASGLPDAVAETLGDRRQAADLERALAATRPDVVIDMVPIGEADATTVAGCCRGRTGRLVALSSMDVYRAYGRIHGTEPGEPLPMPMDEEAPLRERLYPYRGETPRADDDPARHLDDYDKILAERQVLGEPELPGTVLRLPIVYGPGDYQHRLHPYLKRMDDGRPAILLERGEALWRISRAYVDDVAHAVALAATSERAGGRVYNVCESEALAERDWVAAIAQAAGWDGRIEVVERSVLPESLASGAPVEQDLVCTTTRIREELGYAETVDRPAALASTIAWERDHPPPSIDERAFDYATEDAVLAALAEGTREAR
jgi:nucleoside-diphosphate-sugar epimerase